MTIGANLNGGSLTLGAAGATTSIRGTANINTTGSATTSIGNINTTTNISGSTINISGILNICTSGGNTTFGNSTTGATNILGQVNIANDGLPTSGGVNIATNGFGTSSYVTIGSATFPQIYMRSKIVNIANNQTGSGNFVIIGTTGISNVYLKGAVNLADDGGDTTIGTGPSSGNITIGNGTSSRYTIIASNAINIGQYLTGGGYIDIGGAANTTTGYIVLGSINLDANYIRSKNIYMNTDGTGNTNIGNFTGTTNLYSYSTLITGASGNSWSSACLCMISSKASIKGDALGIQSVQDNGQYLISFFNNVNIVRGMIRGINSTSVEYATSSDRRLKKNIQTMDSMLENIMRMKPSSFEWISNDDTGYGFIAQEVYEIFPHLRHKHPSCLESCDVNPCDCSGNPVYYGLDYGQFTPYIIKAMQEMKTSYDAKLQEQSEQIAQLMARVAALESV